MRPRKRESATDRLIAQSVSAALGAPQPTASDSAGAAVAANLYAGALGNSTIKSKVDFAADFLPGLARELIMRGEALFAIESDRSLTPVAMWDISGNANPASWVFKCDIAGPGGNETRSIPREGVCFFTWASKPSARWKGISPLDAAKGMSSLAARAPQSLANEYNATQLYVIPFMTEYSAKDGTGDAEIASDFNALKADARGQTSTLTLTHQKQWAKDERERYFRQERLGPILEQNSVLSAFKAQSEVLSLCGIPPGLLAPEGQSRDAFRLWVSTALEPLAKRISSELTKGLETEVVIDVANVTKQDIVGRARAFGSLVKGGMEVTEAAKISGVLAEDD